MYYLDLFCGIGGFRQAIERIATNIGQESVCVFAADFDKYASTVYEKTYGQNCYYNMLSDETHLLMQDAINSAGNNIDFLFAGFPCQPFSKAGNQEGFDHENDGNLFFEIIRSINYAHPRFVLLENVRNLLSHDKGRTWSVIRNNLENNGYVVDHIILSPNDLEDELIPALRDRIFILCYRNDLQIDGDRFFQGNRLPRRNTTIYKNHNSFTLKKKYFCVGSKPDLENNKIDIINMWDDLHKRIIKNHREMCTPLWPHFFKSNIDALDEPNWKKEIIKRNIAFYNDNRDIYDEWYDDYKELFDSLNRSYQKFEWNCGDSIDTAWKGIIQFRPSGVRVKKPDFIPTLVAINQTPIIGIEKRYLKPKEMARLYGFKKLKFGGQPTSETYKQLGNTVSVDVVEFLIRHMIEPYI